MNPLEEWQTADAELTDRLVSGLPDANTDGNTPLLRPQQLVFPTASDHNEAQSDPFGLEASSHGSESLTAQGAQATTQGETPAGRTNITAQEPEAVPDCASTSQDLPEWFQTFARSYRPRPSEEPASLLLSPLPLKAASTIPISEPHRTPKRQYEPRDGNKSDSERAKKTLRARKARNFEFHAAIKFACPFYKRKPWLHSKHTSCRASGFPNVHRVKHMQHMKKHHMLPENQCWRCQRTFDEQQDLVEHYRAEIDLNCPRLDLPTAEGVTIAQKQLLDKPSQKGQREEEKWRTVYRILFPLDAEIPSPFWSTPKPDQHSECCISLGQSFEAALEELESHVSMESSRRLRDRLAHDNNSLCLSDSQKSGLYDMFSEISSGLIGEFKASKSHHQTRETPDNENAKLKGPPRCGDANAIEHNPGGDLDHSMSVFAPGTKAYREVYSSSIGYGGERSEWQAKGFRSSSRHTGSPAASLVPAAQGIDKIDFRYDAPADTIDPAVIPTAESELGAAFISGPRVAHPAPYETSGMGNAVTTTEGHVDMPYSNIWNPWIDTELTSAFADEVVAGFADLGEEQDEALEPMEDAIAKLQEMS